MQFLSVIMALGAVILVLMNYHNNVSINLLNQKFASLASISPYVVNYDLAIYTLVVFLLGMLSVFFFFTPLYNSLKNKYNAYKRELEKGSISNTTAESKIEVLENKITVLEKALDDALKRKQ